MQSTFLPERVENIEKTIGNIQEIMSNSNTSQKKQQTILSNINDIIIYYQQQIIDIQRDNQKQVNELIKCVNKIASNISGSQRRLNKYYYAPYF